MKPTVGFVGVGKMGANMARHLFDLGYPIGAVYDIQAPVAQALAKELKTASPSWLAEVTAMNDVIITAVTNDAALQSIYEHEGDNLLQGGAGKLFINCATVSPWIHERIEGLVRPLGCDVLEAPMASSLTQARDGTLYLMCAGRFDVYQRAESILSDLALSHRYIGPAGTAAKLKALVNMVMNSNTAAVAEGLALADALGLDLSTVAEVFSQTGAASRVLQTDGGDMIRREHTPFFTAEHAAKDSGIALHLAEDAGLDLPLARATYAQYTKMVEAGLGGLDKSGVAELTFKNRRPPQL